MLFGRCVSSPPSLLVYTVDYGRCTLIQLVAVVAVAVAVAVAEICRMKNSSIRQFVQLD